MSEYTFNSAGALDEQVKALGYTDPWGKDGIIVDISRTPLESIWPSKDVNYGDPPQKYEAVAFGNDVPTPWGLLPKLILLVRKDVIDKLKKHPDETRLPWDPEKATVVRKPSSLFHPGWKPAPGFSDPRKDFK